MKKNLLFFLVLLSFSNTLIAQSDSTEIQQSGYFLTFVKKVYLNPTVYLRTQDFKENTNLSFVALPDLASEKTNASSGFEKGLQKVLRFLMQSDGGVRFYFNPDSTTHPFRFWYSENLHCKFKQADKDSIDYYLNHNFADGNISMTNSLRFETTIDKALDYIEKCITANPQACGEEPQNETTEINTKPLSVSLHNRANSKYDIDVKQYEKLESHYAKAFDIHTQQDWYAPAKLLVPNETAEPVALAIHSNEGDFLKQNIKIEILKTHALLPIDQASTEDSLFFSLPSALPVSDPVEIIVKYKSPKDSNTYTVGFFMVNVMERETKNLVLIPANGFVISANFKDSVETELEKIYGQASVDFNITIESGLAFPSEYPTTIEIENSGLFSNYAPDLRDYVGEVQDLNDYESENYYLIIGLESTELQGYMPRARNIGFIFKSAENKPKVIAHEIGHGAFHFRHIFAEEELGEELRGETKNIMDYVSNPKDLYLHQWNFIKDPAFVSWFGGDDEDAQIIGMVANSETNIPFEWREKRCFLSFITPGKSIIRFNLKDSTKNVITHAYFSNGIFEGNEEELKRLPDGLLMMFVIKTPQGVKKRYDAKIEGTQFKGYYTTSGERFKEFCNSPPVPDSIEDVIVKLTSLNCIADYSLTNLNLVKELNGSQINRSLFLLVDKNSGYLGATDWSVIKSAGIVSALADPLSENFIDFQYSDLFENITTSTIEERNYKRLLYSKIFAWRCQYPKLYEKMSDRQLDDWTSSNVYWSSVLPNDLGEVAERLLNPSNPLVTIKYFDFKYIKGNYGSKTKTEQLYLFLQAFEELIEYNRKLYENIIWDLMNGQETNIAVSEAYTYSYSIRSNGPPPYTYTNYTKTFNTHEMINLLSAMSVSQMALLNPRTKARLINMLLHPGWENLGLVTNELEAHIVRILQSTPMGSYSNALLKDICESKPHGEPMIITMADAIDDETCFWGEDYFTQLATFIVKAYQGYNHELSNLSLQTQDPAEQVLLARKRIVTYNYTGFVNRLGKSIWYSYVQSSTFGTAQEYAPFLLPDPQNMTDAEVLSNGSLKVTNYTEQCFVQDEVTKEQILSFLDPVIIEDKSNLLNVYGGNVGAAGEAVFVPAVMLYFIEKKADAATTVAIIQTVADVLSLAIPGGGALRILTYADKLSSVASLAGSYAQDDYPELAKVLNLTSTVLGIADPLGNGFANGVKSIERLNDIRTSVKIANDLTSGPIYKSVKSVRAVDAATQQNNLLKLTTKIKNNDPDIVAALSTAKNKSFMKKILALEKKAATGNPSVVIALTEAIAMIDKIDVTMAANKFYTKLNGYTENWLGGSLYRTSAKNAGDQIAHFENGILHIDDLDGASDIAASAKLKEVIEDVDFKHGNISKKQDLWIFEENGSLRCVSGSSCFVKGTKVKTNSGFVEIQDLKINDVVVSFDEKTGMKNRNKVLKTYKSTSTNLVRLIFGKDTIWTTPEHPFFTTTKQWLNASLLTIGTFVNTFSGSASLDDIQIIDTSVTVYNLQIETDHTYLVGEAGLVVHNTLSCSDLDNLFDATNNAKKQKFIDDFGDNPEVLKKFLSGELDVNDWVRISGLPKAISSNVDNIAMSKKLFSLTLDNNPSEANKLISKIVKNADEAGNEGQNFKAILQSGLFDDIAELDSYKEMLKKASTAGVIPSIEQTMARAKKYLDEGGNKSLIRFEDDLNAPITAGGYDVDFGIKSSDGIHTYETAFQFKRFNGPITDNKLAEAGNQLMNAPSSVNRIVEFRLVPNETIANIQSNSYLITEFKKQFTRQMNPITQFQLKLTDGTNYKVTFDGINVMFTQL